ncbi:MAG: hypothetical protein NC038_03710 [Paludibacter sp.]|nr:hypothetical protein [Bacteroidales bacterium]MCM1069186.1 hypothetical protein [Prevotella sp.]MCM1354091.1 hypothetical protein [Bacteroides sp.]MCM1442936.1 hypothetical protein [Muribaculum sp.]MCM1481741.1 hypothetical protein [Paludibacter sp.]
MKKRIYTLLILTVVAVATVFADIPKGAVIYLDVTQHWCCKKSYYIYLSRDNKSYKMAPVEGNDGVYQFTTTSSTQDNIRFCYSESETAATIQGQISTHTEDATGWSKSKPYCIIDAENGRTYHWAASPSSMGATALTDAHATLVYDCAEGNYTAQLTISFDGAPCGLRISSALLEKDKVVKTPHSPYEYKVTNLNMQQEEQVSFTVCLYSDAACTLLLEEKTLVVTAPEAICEKQTALTVCVGDELVLASELEAEVYAWTAANVVSDDATGRTLIFPTDKEGTFEVEVTAYKTVVNAERNLMLGGDFEDNVGFTSDYAYVANENNYYAAHPETSNLYTLTDDANWFWQSYAPITPHSGNYFGLFDAGKSGYAWKAETECATDHTKDNPNLIIMKDSIYYFSYWAAHPNETSQSDSPAELQFVIAYDGVEENLGNPYLLPTDDNEWHQQVVTWKAPATSVNVMIGVKDLNPNSGTGNDFCLDDIMFQTVSYSESRVAFTNRFLITVEDCSEPDCTLEVYRKWNDFLFVDNSEGLYSSYQWYCNGQAVAGATGQYYRMPESPAATDEFWVVVNGDTESCHTTFKQAEASAQIYPAETPQVEVARRLYPVSTNFYLIITTYDDGTVKAEKRVIF